MRWAPQKFPRGPSGKWHGSKGALFGGSWIGKSSPGLDFFEKTGMVLRFPFFALNDFWKAPRGSRERAAEQQEFQRGAQGGAPSSLWGPEGGPKTKRDPLGHNEPAQDGPSRPKTEAEARGKTVIKD